MFSRMRERWREARASELRKDVEDSVHRLRLAGDEVNKRFTSYVTTEQQLLEAQFGRLDNLSDDVKLKIAKNLRSQARAVSQDIGRAYTLFFLGAYLDAQTLPGSDAIFIKAMCASLLEADAAINPIQAIKSGNLVEFRRFIQANPHSLDTVYEPNHWTLLHYLAALGCETLPVHSTMALELIKAGANVNCRNPLGWTPLIIIAMQGQKESVSMAKILIEHGADVGAVDKHGCDWRVPLATWGRNSSCAGCCNDTCTKGGQSATFRAAIRPKALTRLKLL